MQTLKSILNNYASITTRELGSKAKAKAKEVDYNILKEELSSAKQSHNTFLWLCTSMVLVMFALSLFLIIYFIDKPDTIVAIFSASGCTVGGLIAMMRKLWIEKVKIDLVLILVMSLKDENIEQIINTLVNKI